MWFKKSGNGDAAKRFREGVELSFTAEAACNEGNYKKAVAIFDRALTIMRTANNGAENTPEQDMGIGLTLCMLASVHTDFGNEQDASFAYMTAIDIGKRLVRESNSSLESVSFFNETMLKALDNFLAFERYEDGLSMSKKVLQMSHYIYEQDKQSEFSQHTLACAWRMVMDFEAGCGNIQEAYDAAAERCDFEMNLLDADPRNPSAKWRLVDSVMDMSKFLEGDRMMAQYDVALALLKELRKEGRVQPHQEELFKRLLDWEFEAQKIVANCHANHNWVAQN